MGALQNYLSQHGHVLILQVCELFWYFIGRVMAYVVVFWSEKILLLLLQIVSPFAGRLCHVVNAFVKRLNVVIN